MLKITLPALVAVALVLGGCGKKDDNAGGTPSATASAAPAPPPTATAAASATAAPTDSAAAPAPSGSAAAGDADDVASYPDEVPQSGTFEVLKEFIVHKGADDATPILTHVGKGTLINLKSSHAGWMKIEYPSGKDELSLGWIQVKVGDSRFKLRKDKMLNGRRRRHW
jgi:hypothetical protein